jgi:hypothetical protein
VGDGAVCGDDEVHAPFSAKPGVIFRRRAGSEEDARVGS